MKRLKEEYLEKIDKVVSLNNKKVLEVGSGSGARSIAIASKCAALEAIEPDINNINLAKLENNKSNINYQQGIAENLQFLDNTFDVVIFTLSLHHVQAEQMSKAIDEAVRVTKPGGYVVFLEPMFDGTYFDSEMIFDAGCGDERAEKALAYYEILKYKNYVEIAEMADETIFKLESVEDYMVTFKPKKNLDRLPDFLANHNYTLNAERRINVFRV